jgi:cytokinin dehydrogenase
VLISDQASESGFDYVEGQVQLKRTLSEGPKSTLFFSGANITRLAGLASRSGSSTLYCIEGAMYYNEDATTMVDQVGMKTLSNPLSLLLLDVLTEP